MSGRRTYNNKKCCGTSSSGSGGGGDVNVNVDLSGLEDCCEGQTEALGDVNANLEALCDKMITNNNLLQTLCTKLVQQTEALDPVLYCDDDCNVTGAVAFYMPENAGTAPTPIYFDATLQPGTVAPTGGPCQATCQGKDIEFKWFEQCRKIEGAEGLMVTCVIYEDGVEQSSSVLYVLPNGSTTTAAIATEPCGCEALGTQGNILDWSSLT